MPRKKNLKERMEKLRLAGVAFYCLAAKALDIYLSFPIAEGIISRREGVVAITRWRSIARENPVAILESVFFPEPAGGLYFDTQADTIALDDLSDNAARVLMDQIIMWEQVLKAVYPATFSAAIIT